jgi:hypothetical protein
MAGMFILKLEKGGRITFLPAKYDYTLPEVKSQSRQIRVLYKRYTSQIVHLFYPLT